MSLYSQETDELFKKIKYSYDKTGNFVEEVHFYDDQTKKIVNKFNLKENNPYNHLPFPIIKDDFLSYNLSGVKLNEIKLNTGVLNIITGSPIELDLSKGVATSYSSVYETNLDYTIVTYYIYFGIGEDVAAYSQILYLFNSKGEIIKVIDELEVPIGDITITDNGYLGIPYEGKVDINYNQLSSGGCLVYDLNSTNVWDFKAPDSFGWSYASSNKNLLIITYENSKSRLYNVYNFEENVKYTKLYDRNVFKKNALIDINTTGFVFNIDGLHSGKTKVDLYSNEFEKEIIK